MQYGFVHSLSIAGESYILISKTHLIVIKLDFTETKLGLVILVNLFRTISTPNSQH